METVTLTIDGQPVTVEKGKTVLQAAVDLPRAQPTADALIAERGLPLATKAALAAKGHSVRAAREPVGSAQIAALDPRTGALDGAADARRDGCVLRA